MIKVAFMLKLNMVNHLKLMVPVLTSSLDKSTLFALTVLIFCNSAKHSIVNALHAMYSI